MSAQAQAVCGLLNLLTLPLEILLLITKQLQLGALSKLAASCRTLKQSLEYELYRRPHSAETALAWAASHGVIATIRRSIEHGANVSAVPGLPERTSSPLYLAAKYSHFDAVECLLELGAAMNTPTTRQRDYHNFLHRLCLHSNTDARTLERLLISEAGKQVIKNNLTSADLCLDIALAQETPSVDVIRLILKLGASPRKLQLAWHDLNTPQAVGTTGSSGKSIGCPLAWAVKIFSAPLFDMLLEHGADIHGKSGTPIRRYRKCVPIYVHAGSRLNVSLAATGHHRRKDTWILKCLEAGADINHPGHQHYSGNTSGPHQPLLYYDEACDHYDEHCVHSCAISAPCRFLCPLTMYLANLIPEIREFPDEAVPELLSEVQFYIDHGAEMSRPSTPSSQQWQGQHRGLATGIDPVVPLSPGPRADDPIVYKFLLNCRHKPDTPPLVYTILHYLWDHRPLTDIAVAKRLLCEHDYCTRIDGGTQRHPPEAQHSAFIRRVISTFWRYHPVEEEEKGVQNHAARDTEFIEMLRVGGDMVDYQISRGRMDFT